jgi:type IV pilus assembly protein PilA
MIGVLAALGLVGYKRYINAAQSTEAKTVIGMIRDGQEAYKSEALQYLNVSGTISTYYPNAHPTGDIRTAWVQPGLSAYTNTTHGWALLNVAPELPVRFGYATVAGIGGAIPGPSDFNPVPTMPDMGGQTQCPECPGMPWYVIQAKCDHDGNGIYAVFASSSITTDIISQNEEE